MEIRPVNIHAPQSRYWAPWRSTGLGDEAEDRGPPCPKGDWHLDRVQRLWEEVARAMKCRLAELPGDDHHGGRVIGFGPDGWPCAAVSAPCNNCEPKDERCGTMLRMRSEG